MRIVPRTESREGLSGLIVMIYLRRRMMKIRILDASRELQFGMTTEGPRIELRLYSPRLWAMAAMNGETNSSGERARKTGAMKWWIERRKFRLSSAFLQKRSSYLTNLISTSRLLYHFLFCKGRVYLPVGFQRRLLADSGGCRGNSLEKLCTHLRFKFVMVNRWYEAQYSWFLGLLRRAMLHISECQGDFDTFTYRQLTTHVWFPSLHAGGLVYARRDLGLSFP